jgi:hypothetical protein
VRSRPTLFGDLLDYLAQIDALIHAASLAGMELEATQQ